MADVSGDNLLKLILKTNMAGRCGAGLIWIKGQAHQDGKNDQMRPLLFRCPVTDLQVQTLVADNVPDDAGTFVTVNCPACSGAHRVNGGTGNVVGGRPVRNHN